MSFFFFFQAEDGIRDYKVTGVQTCALPISGGWRYQAHLMILGMGWVGPATAATRAIAPRDRLAGVDGNVSNIAIASIPTPDTGAQPVLLTSHVTVTDDQVKVAEQQRRKARSRMRALDRSRRASNTG